MGGTLMERIGFAAEEDGPFVTELRARMAEKEAAGLTKMHVSWSGPGDHEERAREMLAVDWEIERGGAALIECLDGWIGWQYRFDTGWPPRRVLRIKWKMLLPWLGDRRRAMVAKWRRWRAGPNPYRNS